jgi:protoporphyrinogen oxidase
MSPTHKRIVVIGGGLSGLAASYDLVRTGHHVTILEATADFGGLASSFRLEGHPVERFYHFICRSDHHLLQLVDEFGLGAKLRWRQTRTAFYYKQRYYPFGTPLDLLSFSVVPWTQRIRFGLLILRSRYRSQWRYLDRIPAKPWLIESIGEQAYNAIWHPLLKVKFGDYYDQISAAWIWHRIWRVARSRRGLFERETFGYLESGTASLVDPLIDWLRAQSNVALRTRVTVEPVIPRDGRVYEVRTGDTVIPCDAVISTVALPTLARLVPDQRHPYFAQLAKIKYIGVVCMLLSLTRPFSNNFWTNINDPEISFNGIIEQTNLNENLRAAGLNVVYVPFYLPTTHPRYSANGETLFAEYSRMLAMMNPGFSERCVKEWHVFRTPYAQAVFTTNFVDLMPAHQTPVKGLYVTDSTQFYPEDRTISAAIEQGRKVAAMIVNDSKGT